MISGKASEAITVGAGGLQLVSTLISQGPIVIRITHPGLAGELAYVPVANFPRDVILGEGLKVELIGDTSTRGFVTFGAPKTAATGETLATPEASDSSSAHDAEQPAIILSQGISRDMNQSR